MAETEVESILREIRERVLSQQAVAKTRAAAISVGNGAGGPEPSRVPPQDDNEIASNLSLIESYLTVTGRAWDRLPPIVSNRTGPVARVELWLKRQLKRATRWYAWEQVNFNAAVHHALRDMLPLLSAHEDDLLRLHGQFADLEQHQAGLSAQLNELHAELEAQARSTGTQVNARVAEVVNEMRQRDQRLQEEQRVCFKQLALETSEAAVLEDRARRRIETLMEELQRRVEDLERSP